jgi:hypothetical protein
MTRCLLLQEGRTVVEQRRGRAVTGLGAHRACNISARKLLITCSPISMTLFCSMARHPHTPATTGSRTKCRHTAQQSSLAQLASAATQCVQQQSRGLPASCRTAIARHIMVAASNRLSGYQCV